FPLHTWLPDAMAGPTPVSALIHAATMVAAGVYVVARLLPVFASSAAALAVLAAMAAVTMVGSALAALAQDDIKRVLAYSTVGQLGYMTGALAVDDRGAAVFHLITHGAFKALLFLGAGVVIHAAGSNSLAAMSRMSGLAQRIPDAFWTMTVALLALAAIPPFAGFFSKEAVLGAAEHAATGHTSGVPEGVGWTVLLAGLLTALLT
ncbi:NADH-quinone oxidoreductase subunit L, partial [Streptomyces albiflaviniger]|nr:NADH-quinone oxidoreductase subunit L [Streptomyces albiflaviniger]